MPEGDTIRRLADRIDARFAGQRVSRSVTRDPRLSGVDFAGRVLLGADAYGKHLFVRFDDGRTLHAHLMMTGSFDVGRASRDAEWKRRVELWLENGRLTGVDVPLLDVIATASEDEVTAALGPDLCAPGGPPDIDEIVGRIRVAPEVPIAGAMLDQRNAAGFGNIYANDVPFITGVSPTRQVAEVGDLRSMIAIGTALIRVNAVRGPQNTTGRRLGTDARWVHGAGPRECPICGTRMQYRDGDHTPWQRSITWCPTCQPEHGEVDLGRALRLIALHPATKQPYFPRHRPHT